MRRRDLITTVGIATFAGCASQSSNGDPTRENTETATPQSPSREGQQSTERGPTTLDVGETLVLDSEVSLTVEDVALAETLETEDGKTRQAGADAMYLLAAVRAQNPNDVTSLLPDASTFSVLAAGRQRRPLDLADETTFTRPVGGEPYHGLQRAPPQTERQGWVVFEVPTSTTRPEIVWRPAAGAGGEIAYWETTVDAATLPDLRVTDLTVPESLENGASATVSITVENRGGRAGTFSQNLSVAGANSGSLSRLELTDRVAQNESVTINRSVDVERLQDVKVTLPGQASNTIAVEPARRGYGDQFETAQGTLVTATLEAVVDSFTYRNAGGESTAPDRQLALHHVSVTNPTDSSRTPPADFEVSAGDFANPYTKAFPDRVVSRPDLGKMYAPSPSAEMLPGVQLGGVIAHEVPADAALDEIALTGTFDVGDEGMQRCVWG